MWSGTIASIPSGWVLCNGSNSTPDLRNKFIIGAHSDSTGTAYSTITGSNTQSGGSKDAIVVSHTHTATVTDPGHVHTQVGSAPGIEGASSNPGSAAVANTPNTGSAVTGISVTNASTGSSGTDQNLPPYYALAYIMKT
jgi:microcystin-dependent protein